MFIFVFKQFLLRLLKLKIIFFILFFTTFSCAKKQIDIPKYPLQQRQNPSYYNRYPVNYAPKSRYYNKTYNIKQPNYLGYYKDYDYYYIPPREYHNYNSDNIITPADLNK